jgi:hypothetical protein
MKNYLPILVLLAAASCGLGYSPVKEQQPSRTPSPMCGITLQVTGGQFSPQACVFEIITPGEPCPGGPCPPDFVLSMKDNDRTHIREVLLFNFKTFAKQTFIVDSSRNLQEFKGQALDSGAAARNLLKGEISLEPIAATAASRDQRVRVRFDVSFANGIQIQGSGEVPVRRVSAP